MCLLFLSLPVQWVFVRRLKETNGMESQQVWPDENRASLCSPLLLLFAQNVKTEIKRVMKGKRKSKME